MATAVLVGSLDTKAREYDFVRSQLLRAGLGVVLVDVGVLGEPGTKPDITAREVSAEAGVPLEALRFAREGSDTRAVALDAMRRGAAAVVARLREQGACDGILGLGGSGGSYLISGVMRTLPLGVPKILVSTMASGDVSAYVGVTDLCVMHSVTDIAGLNRISRPILRNAANALAGMIQLNRPGEAQADRPAVGITMLGVTTRGALRVVERLEAAGYDAIVFHAVGSGGRSLESLIESGVVTGVVDYTIKEVTDALLGGIFDAGPERLRSAGRRGYPQVVVPGAVEVINFGPVDTVPAELRDGSRPLVRHNEQVTAVRATSAELELVADDVASRLNGAVGPTVVMVPRRGFDSYASGEGPFAAPADDDVFITRLRGRLRADLELEEFDMDINDPRFADAVADRYLAIAGKATPVDQRSALP